jgi:RNA polymerase sigma-70 factor (ECF subfamily)
MTDIMSLEGVMAAALVRIQIRAGGLDVRPGTTVRSEADEAMERYAEGDRDSGGRLYDLLRPRLFAIGFQWTRSVGEAEDLVQEAFLRLTEARATFRRGARVLPWACTMARNLLTDGHRRRTFERWVQEASLRWDPEGVEGQPPGDEAPDVHDQLQAALAELERLPAALKDSFRLIRIEGLTVKQAARRLGITEGMVKIRTFRAAAALRAADACRRRGGC